MYVKSHETWWVFFQNVSVWYTRVSVFVGPKKYLLSLSTIRSLGKLKRTKKYNDELQFYPCYILKETISLCNSYGQYMFTLLPSTH